MPSRVKIRSWDFSDIHGKKGETDDVVNSGVNYLLYFLFFYLFDICPRSSEGQLFFFFCQIYYIIPFARSILVIIYITFIINNLHYIYYQ